MIYAWDEEIKVKNKKFKQKLIKILCSFMYLFICRCVDFESCNLGEAFRHALFFLRQMLYKKNLFSFFKKIYKVHMPCP